MSSKKLQRNMYVNRLYIRSNHICLFGVYSCDCRRFHAVNQFIRKIDTFPEVATIGFNEDDLVKRDRKYKKSIVNLTETNASKIYDFRYGFIKLLADKNNRLLGAVIVAPNATSIAAELSTPYATTSH